MSRSNRAIRPPARLAESAQPRPPPRKRPRTRPNVAPPTRTEAPTTSATNVNVGAASPVTPTMAASGMPAAGAGSSSSGPRPTNSTIVSSDSVGGESSCSNVNVTYDNSVFVRPNVIDQVDVHSNGVNVRPSPTGDCVNLGSLSGPDVNVRPNYY